MSWRDLLRALDEEAAREVDGVRAGAARDVERVVQDALRAAAANRDSALAQVADAAASDRRRAMAVLQREGSRDLLRARRDVLDEVRAEALQRLRADDARTVPALADVLAAEVGDVVSTWTADPERVEVLRDHLARAHPRVLEHAELRAATAPRGGVEVQVGRRVLDATAEARLARAWSDAEPLLANLLFGGGS